MAVVLTAVGLFLYLRFEADLNDTVDSGLRSRAGDVSALVKQADSGLSDAGRSTLTDQGESIAQILDGSGRAVDSTPELHDRPLLKPDEIRRALEGTLTLERVVDVGDEENPVRLLATPVDAQGTRLVVVVGASLEDNENAVNSLGLLLAIGGPAALLLASLAGYGVARAALRPVDAMRRQADAIGEHDSGRRLPVGGSRDEIARLGETLNAMLDRLEAAFAREQTFVADASHELRTPLAILKTELELALRAGRSADELRDALASAAEEADRVAQLAEDLLVIARSDRGQLPVRLGPVDAGELFEGLRKRFELRAREAERRVVIESGPGVAIEADAMRLDQALGNLLDNALRYGAGDIRLSAVDGDRTVELHVRDAGTGFEPGFIGQAFERFTRADHSRARGGAGLGMAIVATIARSHGGSAHVRNEPDGGADAWVELPLARGRFD
jgi:signal transduction histidine kinase